MQLIKNTELQLFLWVWQKQRIRLKWVESFYFQNNLRQISFLSEQLGSGRLTSLNAYLWLKDVSEFSSSSLEVSIMQNSVGFENGSLDIDDDWLQTFKFLFCVSSITFCWQFPAIDVGCWLTNVKQLKILNCQIMQASIKRSNPFSSVLIFCSRYLIIYFVSCIEISF